MGNLIIVFGTTAIMDAHPSYPGQPPVYVDECPKHGYSIYSTGKLERALAMEADIYVCTVLPLFRPEDDWWRALVSADRVYKPVLDARGKAEEIYDHFINQPWKRFLRDLGRDWPDGVRDALDWRVTLDGSDGLLYGGRLSGYTGAST